MLERAIPCLFNEVLDLLGGFSNAGSISTDAGHPYEFPNDPYMSREARFKYSVRALQRH